MNILKETNWRDCRECSEWSLCQRCKDRWEIALHHRTHYSAVYRLIEDVARAQNTATRDGDIGKADAFIIAKEAAEHVLNYEPKQIADPLAEAVQVRKWAESL